jgi:hypothetical protein
MVNACPTEGDPKLKVEEFVKNPTVRAIGGLRTQGLIPLMEVVCNEVLRQDPKANILKVDRDTMSEGKVCFSRELRPFLESKLVDGRKNCIFVYEDLINEWTKAVKGIKDTGRWDLQVYYGSLACHAVPACCKLF